MVKSQIIHTIQNDFIPVSFRQSRVIVNGIGWKTMLEDGIELPYKVLKIKARTSLHYSGIINYWAQVYYIFYYLHCHHISHQIQVGRIL